MRRLLLFLCAVAVASGPAKTRKERIVVPVWTAVNAENSTPQLDGNKLTAKLGGAPARVEAVRGPGDELMVLLVSDLTEELSLVETARQALVSTIRALPEETYVGLMRAQDGLTVLVDPTTDRAALADAVQTLPVSGNAGLLDTVETVARLADSILEKSRVRVAILYVTDSDVRNYREDFTNPVINYSDPRDMSRRFPEGLVREKISKVEGVLSALQAPLFVVHLNYRSERLNEAYQAGLIQLARTTGGSSIFCRSRPEIPEAIARIFHEIVSHYAVTLEVPDQPPKILQVEIESEGTPLNYRRSFLMDGK